jgi:hypothetical protein
MALAPCPECGRRVSDRAAVCPGCGYPLAEDRKQCLIKIDILWDDEADVWIALAPDLPGFGLESDKFEVLLRKVGLALPEFLDLNQDAAL